MELGPRVLVVDDDAGVRRMLARVLQQAGFACAQAESADAARCALAEQPVTALLCDVHLVGEDGLSLARWVRTHHRETAVLLITGSTSVEVDDIARHAVDGFLLKPFAAAEILINLRSAIARRTEALDRITSIERELRSTEHRLHETSDHLSETRAALVEREQLWKALVTSAPIGVALASGNGELTFSNDRFAELLDLSRCGDGARSRDWLAALDRRDVDRAVDAIRHPDSASAELRTRIDRGDRTLVMRCSVVDDRCPLSETTVITIEDVSDLVAAQRQFERQQLTDPITGLPNRSALVAHLATRLRTERSAPASVVTLNLNALRDLVLVAGEAAFDLAVGEVAARVARELVPRALLGRSGPTSLAIIVDTDDRLAVMSTVPARLARALTAPVTVGDDDLEVMPRIGIAVASRGSSGESLLRDSTIASEHAEAIGGVRVFNDAMRAEARHQIRLQQALRRAIEQESFDLHFQPIVAAHDRSLVGFEALSRWIDPESGPVAPAVFVPLLDHLGLLGAWGDAVLRKAVTQLAAWQEIGAPTFWVSINASPGQLADPAFPHTVVQLCDEAGVAQNRLCVEVTEESILSGPLAEQGLDQLLSAGVRLALDDFGTGYASLDTLARCRFDIVKVAGALMPPRSGFVSADAPGAAVLAGACGIAHALGSVVVAEAVETDAQWHAAQTAGADLIQGWAFAPALPSTAPALDALVRHGTADPAVLAPSR